MSSTNSLALVNTVKELQRLRRPTKFQFACCLVWCGLEMWVRWVLQHVIYAWKRKGVVLVSGWQSAADPNGRRQLQFILGSVAVECTLPAFAYNVPARFLRVVVFRTHVMFQMESSWKIQVGRILHTHTYMHPYTRQPTECIVIYGWTGLTVATVCRVALFRLGIICIAREIFPA